MKGYDGLPDCRIEWSPNVEVPPLKVPYKEPPTLAEDVWKQVQQWYRTAGKPIPKEEEKPWLGYYQGRQWRIAKNDKQSMKNWAAIQTALTLAAAKRTMADAAPAWELMAPIGEGYLPEMQVSTGNDWVDRWKSVGVVAAVDAPLLAEARVSGKYAARSELEETNKLTIPLSSRIKTNAIEAPGPNATPEEIKEYKRKMNIK
jgi:hypothetical protein